MRTRKDQDLVEEIASHLADEQDSHRERSLPEEEAHRQARLRSKENALVVANGGGVIGV